MTELNPKLMSDLAQLAARYPPEDWERLIECLEDRRRSSQVSRLLRELAATSRARRGRSTSSKRNPPRTPRLRETLARIRNEDPARADLFDEMWLKLRSRELLPTMATVRAFAEAVGLKGLESTKREQAVAELIERLIEMPSGDLEQMMRQTVVEDRELGDEYERWVHLILRQQSTGLNA